MIKLFLNAEENDVGKRKPIKVTLCEDLHTFIDNKLNTFSKELVSLSQSRFQDILSDCLAQDSVLIECDSLVFYLLKSMHQMIHLDAHGGQEFIPLKNEKIVFNWLYYTFLLERFIKMLLNRGMNISLLVFNCHLSIWSEMKLENFVQPMTGKCINLIRKLTIQQLYKFHKLNVKIFDHYWDTNWRLYVQDESPYCILGLSPGFSILMDIFIYHCLGRALIHKYENLHYISIDTIEFTTNSVYSYVWKCRNDVTNVNSKGKKNSLIKKRNSMKKILKRSELVLLQKYIEGMNKEIDFTKLMELNRSLFELLPSNSYKIPWIVYCLQQILNNRKYSIPLASRIAELVLVTLLLQEKTSLNDRAQLSEKPYKIYSNVRKFIVELYKILDELIAISDSENVIIENILDLFDLIDENLLNIVVNQHVENILSSKHTDNILLLIPEEYKEKYQLFKSKLSINELKNSEHEYKIWNDHVISFDNHHINDIIVEDKLYPIRNSLITGIIGEKSTQIFSKNELPSDEVLTESGNALDDSFLKNYRWSANRLLEADFFMQSPQKRREVELAERKLDEYANSLNPPCNRKIIVVTSAEQVFGEKYHHYFLENALQLEKSLNSLVYRIINNITVAEIEKYVIILARQLEIISCEKLIAKLLFLKVSLLRKQYWKTDRVWKLFYASNIALKFSEQMKKRLGVERIDMKTYTSQKKYLLTVLCELGFSAFVDRLIKNSDDEDYPYEVFINESIKQIEDIAVFQLLHNLFDDDIITMIDLESLERKKTRPLSQDLGFKPDDWQWEIIDLINRNESALVCSPTSSGKTFIALYCIEKVLRECNHGVVVYVCPTKALVNQTFAEVRSRFDKQLPEDMKMVRMFTADDQIYPLNCQVLVTIPACLEILLLTAHTYAWFKRLKYVIFDEVHCINEREVGGVWEHLLLLINCPFLALSATIGNPSEFHSWLSALEKPDLPKVNLIVHNTRPRDLVYLLYSPPPVKNQSPPNPFGMFHEIHPLSTLPKPFTKNALKRIPPMTSQQCLAVVVRALESDHLPLKQAFRKTIPSRVFKSTGLITRNDIRKYQDLIIDTIWSLYSMKDATRDAVIKLLDSLSKYVDATFASFWADSPSYGTQTYVKEHIISLVEKLNHDDLLPSIVFSFSRKTCNTLAVTVGNYVEKQKHLFVNASKTVVNELNETYKRIQRENSYVPGEVLRNLKYGVAAHHGGLPQSYLKEVERLFRKGYLKVVFSSSTLATGIHMPARSVVIAGDSVYLTNLIFHQCSGRSGRRSFDSRGRVILFGLCQSRANRLLCTKPPDIQGDLTISTTFILRMLVLYQDTIEWCRRHEVSEEKKEIMIQHVIDNLKRVINQPLFAHGKSLPTTKQLVLHQFRFSIEFLRRQNYIDNEGNIFQYTDLATHLFYIEPYNFLIMYYLRKGLFHNLYSLYTEQQAEKIIFLVICHMIGHIYENRFKDNKKNLPQMPMEFTQAMHKFNEMLNSTFCTYLRIYAKSETEHEPALDYTLPVSKISYWNKETPETVKKLLDVDSVQKPSVCSIFARLSPNSERIMNSGSVFHLDKILRQDIHIEPGSIPFVYELKHKQLSNYAFVLMYEENIRSLKDLEIRTNVEALELEQKLRKFEVDLRKIMICLEHMMDNSLQRYDPVTVSIVRLGRKFNSRMRQCFEEKFQQRNF